MHSKDHFGRKIVMLKALSVMQMYVFLTIVYEDVYQECWQLKAVKSHEKMEARTFQSAWIM